jgi:hypothetical protein
LDIYILLSFLFSSPFVLSIHSFQLF